MKGKISIYFALPNLARLRSRLVEPPKELSSEVRAHLVSIAAEALNEANLKIRAKMIDYIAGREDLKFVSDKHKQQVTDLTSGIFDSVFTVDAESLDALVGKAEKTETAGPGNDDTEEKLEPEQATESEDAPTASAAAKTEKVVAPKAKTEKDNEFAD